MKKAFMIIMTCVGLFALLGCNKKKSFTSISMEEAKKRLENESDYVLVDVRTPEEYAEGHIPGAINIPNEIIADKKLEQLPDLKKRIYVYCRSGRRSKEAAGKMVNIGYTNIVEIGGILDWKWELE